MLVLRRLACCLAISQALTMTTTPDGSGKPGKKRANRKLANRRLLDKVKRTTKASDVTWLMKDNEELIDPFVASTAMAQLRRLGSPREALDLFDKLNDNGLEPEVVTYTAAISACDKSRQWDRAFELFDELKQRGLEPTIIT